MKNILITGVLGHLGSNFAKLLLNNFPMYNIIGIDNEADIKYIKNKEILTNYQNFNYIKGDISDPKLMSNILIEKKGSLSNLNTDRGIDYIFNFAFNSKVLNQNNIGISYINDNISGALNVAIQAIKHWQNSKNYKRYVYISSIDVYGVRMDEECYSEKDFSNPDSVLGSVKHSVESMLSALNKNFGLPVTIIRVPYLIGGCSGVYPIMQNLFSNLLTQKDIKIDLHPESVINIGHIEDILIAIESIFNDKENFAIYNASGFNITVNELIDSFLNIVGVRNTNITFTGKKIGNLCITSDLIYKNLNWKHYTDLEISLKRVISEL